jgi:hypothetical protein
MLPDPGGRRSGCGPIVRHRAVPPARDGRYLALTPGGTENSADPRPRGLSRPIGARAHRFDVTCRFAECGFDHWRRAAAPILPSLFPIETARQGNNWRVRAHRFHRRGLRLRQIDYRHSIAPGWTRRCRMPWPTRPQLKAARMAVKPHPGPRTTPYLNGWLRTASSGSGRRLRTVRPANAGNGLIMPYHLLGEHEKELAVATPPPAHSALSFMVSSPRRCGPRTVPRWNRS